IGNEVHVKILEAIFTREPVKGLDNLTEEFEDAEVSRSPLTAELMTTADIDVPITPVQGGVALEASDDPVTGMKVRPPPYVTALFATNTVLAASVRPVSNDDQGTIRLLGYYFSTCLGLCSSQEGRAHILTWATWNCLLCSALLGLGIWQSVRAISEGNEFGTYLLVVLTALYSFFLAWEILFFKGLVKLRNLQKSQNIQVIQECLEEISNRIEHDRAAECDVNVKDYVTTAQDITKRNVLSSLFLIASYVGSYLALHIS
ncbi:unnamed protein product, partial [Symbiodinium microadriaticum]